MGYVIVEEMTEKEKILFRILIIVETQRGRRKNQLKG